MTRLPDSWNTHRLDEIADIRLGRQRSPKNHQGPQMRPYLRAANVGWAGLKLDDVKSMNFSDSEMGIYQLSPGDVLLSEASGSPGEVGKPALWSGELDECAFQNTLIRIRPHDVDPSYLLHYFRYIALTGGFTGQARGVGIHHLGRARIARWLTPVPPPDEQRRIVDILEDHLSRLDAADCSVTTAMSRASTLRASIIDRAAQGTLDGAEAGEDGLARGWAWVPPVAVSDDHKGIVIGPFGSNLKTSDYRTVGVPLVFVRNVRQSYFGPIGRRYVSVNKATELSSHQASQGDVVITKMGDPPGDAAVYDASEPAIVTADVIRLRPRGDQSSDYLALALNSSMVGRQIAQITRGVAQKKVSLARFRAEVRIPVPDHETQVRVARRVEDLTSGVGRIVRESEAAKLRALSLRRSLLAAAFSGRLTGRTTDLEMVEEMADV
jgi:type I restriction enzyme S subunit